MLNSNKRREREHFHEEEIRNSRMGLPVAMPLPRMRKIVASPKPTSRTISTPVWPKTVKTPSNLVNDLVELLK